jgi:hypothetical protein
MIVSISLSEDEQELLTTDTVNQPVFDDRWQSIKHKIKRAQCEENPWETKVTP